MTNPSLRNSIRIVQTVSFDNETCKHTLVSYKPMPDLIKVHDIDDQYTLLFIDVHACKMSREKM